MMGCCRCLQQVGGRAAPGQEAACEAVWSSFLKQGMSQHPFCAALPIDLLCNWLEVLLFLILWSASACNILRGDTSNFTLVQSFAF